MKKNYLYLYSILSLSKIKDLICALKYEVVQVFSMRLKGPVVECSAQRSCA